MENVTVSRKKFLAVVVGVCLCALLVAVPAYALFYVHGNDYGVSEVENGAMEVVVTIDETAIGKTAWSGVFMVPANATAEQCLEQAIKSSENQNGITAIHDYSYSTAREFMDAEGGSWTITVYEAEAQKPGTHTTQDTAGTDVSNNADSYVVGRYDQVVARIQG